MPKTESLKVKLLRKIAWLKRREKLIQQRIAEAQCRLP
jgi:hypothetical protein